MKLPAALIVFLALSATSLFAQPRNHIVMIMVDDLNDFVEPLALKNPDGTPREGNIVASTPNMTRLAKNGLLFSNAHSNSPICNPSRSSMMHGILPSTARFYGFKSRKANPVFSGTKTLPKLMGTIPEGETQGAYRTFYTGKTFHINAPFEYERTNGIKPQQVPLPHSLSQGQGVMHPDYPIDRFLIDGKNFYQSVGALDCIYGSLDSLADHPDISWHRPNKDGVNRHATDLANASSKFREFYPDAGLPDVYDPDKADLFYYVNDDERDLMTDELSAKYMQLELDKHFANNGHKDRPVFMIFGIMNPHTPMVAPKKYFDLYPLESLDLSFLENNGGEGIAFPNYDATRGNKIYRYLREAYRGQPDELEGIKKYLQAYLACTSHADDVVGQVLDYLSDKIDPNTGEPMIRHTTVILFADHGYHLGQKEWAYKYSMWDDSTHVPLIISDPRYPDSHGRVVDLPVSLVDLYPTVVELGDMAFALDDRITSEFGQALDGTSLVPFLQNPDTTLEQWGGLPMALSMRDTYATDIPRDQIAAVRSQHFRYIRYGSERNADGQYANEEFYDYRSDPLETNNLILNPDLYPSYEAEINRHRAQMDTLLTDDPKPVWDVPLPGETLLAGWHSFLDSAPARLLRDRPANDTIDPGLVVTLSQGPENDITDTAAYGENLLAKSLTETSPHPTYGGRFPLGSDPLTPASAVVMNGKPQNYLLFKFQNQSDRRFRLSSLHFDARFQNSRFIDSFVVSTVADPEDLLGNGLAPKRVDYSTVSIPYATGDGQFDAVELKLAAVPLEERLIEPGETLHLMLSVTARGWPTQALSYLDNVGFGGIVVSSSIDHR